MLTLGRQGPRQLLNKKTLGDPRADLWPTLPTRGGRLVSPGRTSHLPFRLPVLRRRAGGQGACRSANNYICDDQLQLGLVTDDGPNRTATILGETCDELVRRGFQVVYLVFCPTQHATCVLHRNQGSIAGALYHVASLTGASAGR